MKEMRICSLTLECTAEPDQLQAPRGRAISHWVLSLVARDPGSQVILLYLNDHTSSSTAFILSLENLDVAYTSECEILLGLSNSSFTLTN